MNHSSNHYETLGVLPNAEDIVIRAAYRALSQRYHPDRHGGRTGNTDLRMQEINVAYAVLSDFVKRREYDAVLRQSKADSYLTESRPTQRRYEGGGETTSSGPSEGSHSNGLGPTHPGNVRAGVPRLGERRVAFLLFIALIAAMALWLLQSVLNSRSKEPVAALASQGDIGSQIAMGQELLGGGRVERNVDAAISWFERAAERGSAEAQFRLAELYLSSVSERRDERAGLDLLVKSAKAGYGPAQDRLGTQFQYGQPVDLQAAVSSYRSAAEQGHRGAQVHLALMYDGGKGVAEDLIQAYAWTILATDYGVFETPNNQRWHDMNLTYLKRLEERMSNRQIAEAKELSKRLKAARK